MTQKYAKTYQGKPCRKAGHTERYVSTGSCVACAMQSYHADVEKAAEKARKWRLANPGRAAENVRKWREDNPERVKEYSKEWHAKNYDRVKPAQNERTRQWAKDNADRVRENHLRWSTENRDHVNKGARESYSRNPGRNIAHKHNRRTRVAGNGGRFTAAQAKLILLLQNGECMYCDRTTDLHLDHAVPVARGGTSSPFNLQYLCQPHNQSKGAKTDAAYRQRIGLPPGETPLVTFFQSTILFG